MTIADGTGNGYGYVYEYNGNWYQGIYDGDNTGHVVCEVESTGPPTTTTPAPTTSLATNGNFEFLFVLETVRNHRVTVVTSSSQPFAHLSR